MYITAGLFIIFIIMFYIIASRLPLVYSDSTKRKYLKLFILGSIIYLCVHYYLFLEQRTGLLDKVKSKLYPNITFLYYKEF